MDTYNTVGDVLAGRKPMPDIPVKIEIDTVSIIKLAGVLLVAGLLFSLINKAVN